MILLILRGVPASGKSTHAEQLRQQGWTVVNRDNIRFNLYGKYWGKGVDEDVVTTVENATIDAALRANANVVLDATNLNAKAIRTKLSLASRYGAMVSYRDFEISAYEAVARDAYRERQVGESVIVGFFKRYKIDTTTGVLPKPPEPLPKFLSYVGNPNKPTAFIVDVDGTLAENEPHRSPYDTSKYHMDTVHEGVKEAANGVYEHHEVMILSGRSEDFRVELVDWLIDNEIGFTEIFMRGADDKRMDALVKYELFKEYIEPNYNVLGAFDDRPQVLRMWQAIGVPTFSVGPGLEF